MIGPRGKIDSSTRIPDQVARNKGQWDQELRDEAGWLPAIRASQTEIDGIVTRYSDPFLQSTKSVAD